MFFSASYFFRSAFNGIFLTAFLSSTSISFSCCFSWYSSSFYILRSTSKAFCCLSPNTLLTKTDQPWLLTLQMVFDLSMLFNNLLLLPNTLLLCDYLEFVYFFHPQFCRLLFQQNLLDAKTIHLLLPCLEAFGLLFYLLLCLAHPLSVLLGLPFNLVFNFDQLFLLLVQFEFLLLMLIAYKLL